MNFFKKEVICDCKFLKYNSDFRLGHHLDVRSHLCNEKLSQMHPTYVE